MPDNDRARRRKEKARYLRSLGFSDARINELNEASEERINEAVRQERNRISKKAVSRRTPAERERLNALRESQTPSERIASRRRMTSRGERYNDFRAWSSPFNGFPNWAIERIKAYNAQAGEPQESGYGYRRFYYWYVERFADYENEFYADRGDSGIRKLRLNTLRTRQRINVRKSA